MCLLLVPAVACGCGDEPSPPSPSPERVVARVNGQPITGGDVERAERVAAFLGGSMTDEEALESVIGDEIVRQEGARLGVEASEVQVDAREAAVAASVGGQEEIVARLEAGGLTRAEFREALETTLVGEAVQDEKCADVAADESDARLFYDENPELFTEPAAVRLGDIAVRQERGALNVIVRIEAGQPFATAARQFSVDPELRDDEGMLGWVTVASLPPEARDVIDALRPVELSRPVGIAALWHIFKVFDRRAQTTQSFVEVESTIRAELTRRRRAGALAKWVEEERRRADVVVLDTSP